MEWQKPKLYGFEEDEAMGQCANGSGDAGLCTNGNNPVGACADGNAAPACAAGTGA